MCRKVQFVHPLSRIANKECRHVVGLISGTSADGIDAVVAELCGSGSALRHRVLAFETLPLPAALRTAVLDLCEDRAGIDVLCQINAQLGALFAEAVLQVVDRAGMQPGDIDLIGSHGQTVRHLPNGDPPSTLQIGDASVIAQHTGIVTVADFRPADMAVGGQGAPLVPLADCLLFGDGERERVLLNIGGIANVTIVAAGARPQDVCAFDTGPGNMLIDAAVERATGGRERFDKGGMRAARGTVDSALLERLMQHPYLRRQPPKSTGREEFGTAFLDEITQSGAYGECDLLATLTEFSARSIAEGISRAAAQSVSTIWVAGGGVHNAHLLERLRCAMGGARVESLAELGVDPDAREALSFAVLANETIMGRVGNAPAATGARRAVVLGKIALP